jgi:uncharacterized protein YodC (DUF2158 family)
MEKQPKVKIGDVVKLKSGGPKMTVNNYDVVTGAYNEKEGIMCVWFEGNTPTRQIFHVDTLEVVEDKEAV